MIKKSVTMSDIAKAMNVSTVTVSKALGGREGVSEALRGKIKQKAVEMGYRVHTGSRAGKDGLTYNIGIIVAKQFINEPSAFYWIIYKHLVEFLQKQNYYGMLEVVDNENGIPEIPNSVSEKKVDGLIVLGQFSENYVDKLMSYYIPTVLLDFCVNREDADAVLSDNFYGAFQLTSHIIANGHRKIAFIGNVHGASSIQDRFLGYYKALLENRISLRQEWIIRSQNTEGETLKSFELPEEMPTAFVCSSDECAFNLVNQLKSAGLRVPQDVSVAGYENHIYSTMSSPHLTTMDVDGYRMAKAAVEILLAKARSDEGKHGRTLISGKLIVRDSVRNLFS